MAVVPFVKATACGNDFLIIDQTHAPDDIHAFTRKICDRHNGVGADGVEWVMVSDDADIGIRLLNADGSEAEISGNGTRCVAAWYSAEKGATRVVVHTGAGIKTCDLTAYDGRTFQFRSSMGRPHVDSEFSVMFGYGEAHGTPVSMGNPHYVIFAGEFEPGWQLLAGQIATHPDFPHGTNVELVRTLSSHELEVRFYERGVGETMSSGTGSCAAAVASIHARKAESPVVVQALGGVQTVEWAGEVFLTGPATLLCRGEFFI